MSEGGRDRHFLSAHNVDKRIWPGRDTQIRGCRLFYPPPAAVHVLSSCGLLWSLLLFAVLFHTQHFVSPVLGKSNAEIEIEGVGKSKSEGGGVDVMVDILE